MTAGPQQPAENWERLKSGAENALRNLLSELPSHAIGDDPQSLFEAYTYSKAVAAQAMQVRMLTHLPTENSTFRELRVQVKQNLDERYGKTVPEQFRAVPYGSETHERLFSLLQEQLGKPVPASMLRIVTGDNVHTERRARELREIGLHVEWSKVEGISVYQLCSLEIKFDMTASIIRNRVKKSEAITDAEKKAILSAAGISFSA